MRVIAGKYKNKRIVSKCKGVSPHIKPTAAKIKEAVFSIIFNYLEKNGQKMEYCSFLDLYCGTGAIGIEAISRGFTPVYFVDQNRDCIALTKYNLSNISNNDLYKIIKSDVAKLQISLPTCFDIVYLDPPYNYDNGIIQNTLNYILQFTHSKSLIIVEASKDFLAISVNSCRIVISKNYSNCAILGLVRA